MRGMRKLRRGACVSVAVIATATLCGGSSAVAATNIALPTKVMLDVAPYCTISIGQNLNFGTPAITVAAPGASGNSVSLSMPASSAQGIVYTQCSVNQSYWIYAPASGNESPSTQRRLRNGSAYLPYQVTAGSGSSSSGMPFAPTAIPFSQSAAASAGPPYAMTGAGNQQATLIYATVRAANLDTSYPVGAYTDTLNFTVYY
jgi:spore coat protein U-like protein